MRTPALALALTLAAACGGGKSPPPNPEPGPGDKDKAAQPTADDARAFLDGVDRDLRRLAVAAMQTEWDKQTDITDAHEAAAAEAGAALMTYTTQAIKESRRFDAIIPTLDEASQRK